MGKAGDAEQAAPSPGAATSNGSTLRRYAAAIGQSLSAKCVVMLFLGVGVFISAFFLLLRLRASGIIPDDPGTLAGEIQASFILLKPPTQMASHAAMLEEQIHREIGVPNSKVYVSMQTFLVENATYVEFGILPDPVKTSISAKSIRALRKNLIRLTLQQMNLSLTPSVFGDPFCLEVLEFPGGITMEVELPQYTSSAESVQPIFNITLEMSIRQIRELLEELKKNLGRTLELAPYKEIHIDLTNKNGSTIKPPVTVRVSLSPDDRSIYQEPRRLKQLAEIITESSSRNLGLNPSVFGRIKDFKLAPYLQGFAPSFSASSSPTPIPSPSEPPYPQPNTTNLCEHCLCPDLVKMLNPTFPHRKLMRLSTMATSSQLTTHRHGGNRSGRKKDMALQWRHQPSSGPQPNHSNVLQQLNMFQVPIGLYKTMARVCNQILHIKTVFAAHTTKQCFHDILPDQC